MRAKKVKLDSVAITVKVMPSLTPNYIDFEEILNHTVYQDFPRDIHKWESNKEFRESRLEFLQEYIRESMLIECHVNSTKMKYKPVRLTFPHIDRQTSLRKLLWHEDDLISNVSFCF